MNEDRREPSKKDIQHQITYGLVKAMTDGVIAFFHAVIIGADYSRKGRTENGYTIKI